MRLGSGPTVAGDAVFLIQSNSWCSHLQTLPWPQPQRAAILRGLKVIGEAGVFVEEACSDIGHLPAHAVFSGFLNVLLLL